MKSILSNRIIIISVLVVIIGAIAAIFFLPDSSAESPSIPIANITASVLEPADGSQYDDHGAINVRAQAASPDNIVSLELWVDGSVESILAAPQGGLAVYTTEYLWQPSAPGDHTLVVKAVDALGHSVYSPARHVLITAFDYEGGFSEDAADGGPTVLAVGPASPGAVPLPPAPIPPAAGDDVGVSNPWSEPPADDGDGIPPAAPMLTLAVADCAVMLSIQDLSDNEDGFAVYRQMPNSAAWIPIAQLSAQSENEWITYTDPGAPGMPMYYASAFNSAGEASSNLVPAVVDPSGCPENEGELPALSIELAKLQFDMPVGQSYCYQSLGGQAWTRWPDTGFFMTDDDGVVSGENMFQIVIGDYDGNAESLTLALDCWGWEADELYSLGHLISPLIEPGASGQFMLLGEGVSVEIIFVALDLFDKPEVVTYDLHETYDYDMVEINAYVTEDINDCKVHLPPMLNASEQDSLCTPYPPAHWIYSSPLPQSYLVWDIVGDICLAGVPLQDKCRSYAQWQSAFNQFGQGQFGFEVYEFNDLGMTFGQVTTTPFLQRYVIPRSAECGSGRVFTVRMWFEFQGETVYSWPKDSHLGLTPTSIPCRPPINEELLSNLVQAVGQTVDQAAIDELNFVIMQVTITTLTLANSDDDDFFDSQETLEIFGSFKVATGINIDKYIPWEVRVGLINVLGPAMYRNRVLLYIAENTQHSSCPDDIDSDGSAGQEDHFCPKRVTDGSYSIAGWVTCLGNTNPCQETRPGGMATIFNPQMTNNNVMTLLVLDNVPLFIQSFLRDWDDGSSIDNACIGHVEFIARTLAEWAAIQNAPFTIIGTGIDGGTCTVSGFITAIGP